MSLSNNLRKTYYNFLRQGDQLRRSAQSSLKGTSVKNMLKFLLTFGCGIYAGIYISQNYEIPRVDNPSKIIDRIKEITDEYRKK